MHSFDSIRLAAYAEAIIKHLGYAALPHRAKLHYNQVRSSIKKDRLSEATFQDLYTNALETDPDDLVTFLSTADYPDR